MNKIKSSRGDTKSQILVQARRLFARHGYDAVSMRGIAGEVGVQQSAIYNHFPSKQDILVDLMVSHMEMVISNVDKALEGVDGPVAQLKAFARFHVLYHIEFPEDVFLAYMELRSLEAETRPQIVALRQEYEIVLRGILREGMEAGLFHIRNLTVHARAILAMLTGVTTWYRTGGDLDADEVASTYIDAVMKGVGDPA